MTVLIINSPVPSWVKCGEKRPPERLREFSPREWERQLFVYGDPGEIGKYMAEQSMERVRGRLK